MLAVPAILENGTLFNVPLWAIGAFFGAAFILVIVSALISFIFSGEERPKAHSRRIRQEKEEPHEIIDEFKEKYGLIQREGEGLSWAVILFIFIFAAFLGIVGFLLSKYFKEGEPEGKEFVPYVREAIVKPVIKDIRSRININK